MSDKQSIAVSYKVMRHEKEYLKIIAANIVNRFGDSVDAVAFGWLIYQLTGSREWLAVILGVSLSIASYVSSTAPPSFVGGLYQPVEWVVFACLAVTTRVGYLG